MQAELRACGVDPDVLRQEASSREPARERLERHLASARSRELWQPLLITAANKLIETIWQHWPETVKRAYYSSYHNLFQVICGSLAAVAMRGQRAARGSRSRPRRRLATPISLWTAPARVSPQSRLRPGPWSARLPATATAN
jgi:hypothetical protein